MDSNSSAANPFLPNSDFNIDSFVNPSASNDLNFPLPLTSLSKLPNIDSLPSFPKLPDAFSSFPKLPSTDALDFLTSTPSPPISAAAQPQEHLPVDTVQVSAFNILSPRAVAQPNPISNVTPLGVSPLITKSRTTTSNSTRSFGSPVSTTPRPNPDSEAKRLLHNKMMRENRERANRKFSALEALLQRCACADVAACARPMRNKMQVLDRAMAQYPAMRARRALLRAELVLAQQSTVGKVTHVAPAQSVDTLARLLLACQGWKLAEVWKNGRLVSALLSARNMLATANALRSFASSGTARSDGFARRAELTGSNVWIPDLRTCTKKHNTRIKAAERTGVSTALYVPLKDSVLALYHADDELLSMAPSVRPYSAETISRVDELVELLHLSCR